MSGIFRLSDIRDRITTRVPDLANRLGSAGQFSKIIEQRQMPQQTPYGFVLPGVIQGGSAEAATGIFRQSISNTLMVVLFIRVAGDALGDRGLDEVEPLVGEVITAVCGWGPDTAPGVFVLAKAELVGSDRGTLIYQIDFSLNDQLRINP